MAKKKYGTEQKKSERDGSQTRNHFPGISKRDFATLQELTDILKTIPEHEQTEDIRTDLSCYKFVRDAFIEAMKTSSHRTIKLNRTEMSDDEKKIFHKILILVLEYDLNNETADMEPYTKKELKEKFALSDEGFKRYHEMMKLIEKNQSFKQELRKGFETRGIIPDGSPSKGMEFALQGVKLFVQRNVDMIRLHLGETTASYQKDLHQSLSK